MAITSRSHFGGRTCKKKLAFDFDPELPVAVTATADDFFDFTKISRTHFAELYEAAGEDATAFRFDIEVDGVPQTIVCAEFEGRLIGAEVSELGAIYLDKNTGIINIHTVDWGEEDKIIELKSVYVVPNFTPGLPVSIFVEKGATEEIELTRMSDSFLDRFRTQVVVTEVFCEALVNGEGFSKIFEDSGDGLHFEAYFGVDDGLQLIVNYDTGAVTIANFDYVNDYNFTLTDIDLNE